MPTVKKLVFALPFILTLFAFYQNLNAYLGNIYLIFSLDLSVLWQIATLLLLALFACLFFTIFITLSQDKRIILPVAFLGPLSSLFLLPSPFNLVMFLGTFISLTLANLTLSKKLSSYLTFQPTNILIPSIHQLSLLLLIFASIAFYLASDAQIRREGFQIPDSVIDPIIAMNMPQEPQTQAKSNQPQIPPEQLEMLRQNPALLKQYGLDPSVLDQIDTQSPNLYPELVEGPQSAGQALIKTEVKKQINSLIAPQIQFLPIILTALFFLTLKFGLSILSLVLTPLVWAIFWILEKIGFVKFTTEMRPVRKLVTS